MALFSDSIEHVCMEPPLHGEIGQSPAIDGTVTVGLIAAREIEANSRAFRSTSSLQGVVETEVNEGQVIEDGLRRDDFLDLIPNKSRACFKIDSRKLGAICLTANSENLLPKDCVGRIGSSGYHLSNPKSFLYDILAIHFTCPRPVRTRSLTHP